MNIYKIAVIGCGRIAGHNCRTIANTKGLELVAVCDLDAEKANIYRDEFGCMAFTNYHTMLTEIIDIDIVAIITPSGRKVYPSDGNSWRFSKEKLQDLISDNRIWFGEKGDNVPRIKSIQYCRKSES